MVFSVCAAGTDRDHPDSGTDLNGIFMQMKENVIGKYRDGVEKDEKESFGVWI